MSHRAAIIASDVSKAYSFPVLKSLNLEIRAGKFTVLLGKNGSGKSTLLRLIYGQEAVDSGAIRVLGTEVDYESLSRRQSVVFISEQITLDPFADLVKIAEVHRSLYPKWSEGLLEKFIVAFGLDLRSRFGHLSRGQRIQFFFALAAASQPDLYLLDEVTSVLDANARFEVFTHLKAQTAKGATVVLATNIAAETHNFAHHVVFLSDGQINFDAPLEEMQSKFVKFRLAPEMPSTEHSRPVQINKDGSISYLTKIMTGQVLPGPIDNRGVTIEDVFVYFTGPEASK
jgi:ABC-2 type transport system ATP-binding protein